MEFSSFLSKLKSKFKNKTDERLQELFTTYANYIVESSEKLHHLFNQDEPREELIRSIIEYEHKGDELKREIHRLIDKLFITSWLDKYDAVHLADELDHCLNSMKRIAMLIQTYDIRKIRPKAREFTKCISNMTREIPLMIEALKGFSNVRQHQKNIAQCEIDADQIYYDAISNLIEEEKNDPLLIIKWKDIFQALEVLTDDLHHVSQIVFSIVQKMQ